MLVDTHCHLDEESNLNVDEVVHEMNGIIIVSGYNDESNKKVIEFISKYPNVYGTIGFHPENIDELNTFSLRYIEDNIENPKIVGIGEIGLDYYWRKDNKEEQKELLKKQLELASKYNKPIVVHSRDSIQDIYDILKNYKLKGSIHCFNSSIEMANEFIKLGYKIGVGGVVTFKNAKKLQKVVKEIDLSNILLETDSPYLTPEPYRGIKNKPSNVILVANKIAELKNIDVEEVINVTGINAKEEFDLNF